MPRFVATQFERFDAMTLRERLLVWLVALLGIGAAWYLLLMAPTLKREARLATEIAETQQRIDGLSRGTEAQAALASGNRSVRDRRRLVEIEARRLEVEARLETRAADLIAPSQMAAVMKDLLVRQHGLSLVRLENLPPEALVETGADGRAALYRHGLRLKIEGSYLAALRYLDELEALPWRFSWALVDIDARDYPTSLIVIEVATLSLDEDWIGV